MNQAIARPKPQVFHAKISVPQDVAPPVPFTVAQLQEDLQAGLDGDSTLPSGTSVEVFDHIVS